jgi:hypothetical protein
MIENRFVHPLNWSSLVMLAAVMVGSSATIVALALYLAQMVE